jgi:hypothetical protein
MVPKKDAGAVNVLLGSSDGLTDVGDQFWHQGLPTVSSHAEEDDRMGVTLATGDFDGNGTIDLAVGVSYEDVGNIKNAGAVNVLYSSSIGLIARNEPILHQDQGDIPGQAEEYDYFGDALAVGDFDGDGYADLAVGVPYESIDGHLACGAVIVIPGSSEGLTDAGSKSWTVNMLDPQWGIWCDYDNFGLALAAGDFDRDGYSDLAAAAPWDVGGTVWIIPGSEGGLTASGFQMWDQPASGVPGDEESGDLFGHALAVGDFDGDMYSDLAIGIPGDHAAGVLEAGSVKVLYGASGGLEASSLLWHQNMDGVASSAEVQDHFGWALAAGDLNADGKADLAIGVPDEDVESIVDAGAVNVLYGSADGLEATGDPAWNQSGDVAGMAEVGDAFGKALAMGRTNADAFYDLAVGVPNQDHNFGYGPNDDAGEINILYGSSGGLTAANGRTWHQDDEGVDDMVEEGDMFGSSLAFGHWSTALAKPSFSTENLPLTVLLRLETVTADYYAVYRSSSLTGPRQLIGTTDLDWYADGDVPVAAPHYYWVQACNVYGCGPMSEEDSGYRTIAAPGVQASDGTSPDMISVTWTDQEGATLYTLFRATSSDMSDAVWDDFVGLQLEDTGVEPDVYYYYQVKGCTDVPSWGRICGPLSDVERGYCGEQPHSWVYLPMVVR